MYDLFDLRENLADKLPPPTDEEVPSAELLDVLGTAHNDNPVKAWVAPLERYLGHAESLGQTPTFGLLRASQVGLDTAEPCSIAGPIGSSQILGKDLCARGGGSRLGRCLSAGQLSQGG